MFSPDSALATFIRASIFLQIVPSMSLLFACERSQILLLITGVKQASSYKVNIIMNLIMFIIPVSLAIFYPHVGSLASILAGIIGIFVIYMMPTVTFLVQQFREMKRSNVDIEELIQEEDTAEEEV